MANNTTAGSIVHTTSIIVPCTKYLWLILVLLEL